VYDYETLQERTSDRGRRLYRDALVEGLAREDRGRRRPRTQQWAVQVALGLLRDARHRARELDEAA
jgi:hypothetical protein